MGVHYSLQNKAEKLNGKNGVSHYTR